jgi:hypothetical protein
MLPQAILAFRSGTRLDRLHRVTRVMNVNYFLS